jgi:hypothetical protein
MEPALAGSCGRVSVSAETISGAQAILAVCLSAAESRFSES